MRRALGLSVVLGTVALVAACEEQDPYGDRRNQVERNGDAGDDGSAHARELFQALEGELAGACGKTCHDEGSFPGSPPKFLAGPDVYATIKGFPGFVTRSVFESRLLAKPVHEGGSLGSPENDALRKKVVEWLDAEATLLVEKASLSTPVFDIAAGGNTVDLGALAPGIPGAKLSFDASLGPAFLSLSKMRVRGADNTAVRVVHPTFRLVRGGGELPDPVDSFSNLDDKFPQAQEKALGPGQLFLLQWKAGDRLRITFETIEPTTIPVLPDDPNKPCKALQAFIDNAKPQFQNNGCLDCHGDGGNGQATMDLSQLDGDDAQACVQALKKVDLANKGASLLIQSPAGNRGHTGGKVDDPAGYTDAIRAWIDNE